MILITGDIHGTHDIAKLGIDNEAFFSKMKKSDYLIICGDFGLVWDNGEEDRRWRDWLDQRNYTTLFVDGNHENFDLLNSYPVQQWCGGKIHRISDSIIHLMRGQVFEIDGKSFFTMGGAESHDKADRIWGESYWNEELPSEAEYTEALRNLRKHDYKVDYIISHCATTALQEEIIKLTWDTRYKSNPLLKFFDELSMMLSYKRWFCGHYHVDLTSKSNPKICVVFDEIVEVKYGNV